MTYRSTRFLIVGLVCCAALYGQDEKSTDELARELSNPTAALAGLANNFDFKTFAGDLPGASEQSSFSYLFQPTIPFPQGNGYNVLFRPAVPVLFNQPVFMTSDGPTPVVDQFGNSPGAMGPGSFSGAAGLGEMGFDLAYGGTKSGFLHMVGMIGTLPTSTNEFLGKDQLSLGPEVAVGIVRKWGVIGTLIGHQWDVAGGDEGVETSATMITYFYGFGLGSGWMISAGPIITYDYTAPEGRRLALPLGTGLTKVIKVGKTPVRIGGQVWKYVARPDNFGSDWQVRFTVTPVISLPWGG